jgi:ABC-type nitrate/sulfonate/bicarbonate transport system permease component
VAMTRTTRVAWGEGTFVVLLALWQLVGALGWSNLKYLPRPTEVLAAAGRLVATGPFWTSVGHTAWVALAGWAIGGAIGIVAGTLIGLSPVAQKWTFTSLDVFRAIPVVAVLPVMVLLLGLTTKMELYLVVYASVWPVLLNAIAGVSGVSRALRDVGATLRLGRGRALAKIVFPAAVSQISVGVNLALSIALVITVVSEIIASPAGVGHEITTSQSALQPAQMFAYIAVTGLMGLAFAYGLQLLYRAAKPGMLGARR